MNISNKALMLNILVVDDDPVLVNLTTYNLTKAGYRVIVASDGEKAIELARQEKPDLILLDWLLPKKSGIEVCDVLHNDTETTNIPIIMVSAKDEDLDKVAGLEKGADDYITKPFVPMELLARIKAVLRRSNKVYLDKKLTFHDIELDMMSYTVTRPKGEVKLSPIEFQILRLLMENPNRVLSRQTLIKRIWGAQAEVDFRTVDVHITRLRKSLLGASDDKRDIIKTVRLVGYKMSMT